MDDLQDYILTVFQKDGERLFEYAARAKIIRKEAFERFIAAGGTVEKVKSELHARLDGYLGREPYRGDLNEEVERFLPILRWAQTRLNDKLYHAQ